MDEVVKVLLEKFLEALVEYFIKSPVWLICLALLYSEGYLILLLIFGFKLNRFKIIKKIGAIIIPMIMGIGFSTVIFLFQNFSTIFESKLTLELLESNMLSSIFFSFAIVGAISIIILPFREIKRLKGGNRNNGNNGN